MLNIVDGAVFAHAMLISLSDTSDASGIQIRAHMPVSIKKGVTDAVVGFLCQPTGISDIGLGFFKPSSVSNNGSAVSTV